MLIATTNIFIQQIKAVRASRRDTRRLRIALAAELEGLADLMASNRQSLINGTGQYALLRSCMTVYRGSIARITSVPDEAIGVMVRAYAAAERVDHLIATTAKSNGPLGYRVVDKDVPIADLVQELTSAEDLVGSAMVVLRIAIGGDAG